MEKPRPSLKGAVGSSFGDTGDTHLNSSGTAREMPLQESDPTNPVKLGSAAAALSAHSVLRETRGSVVPHELYTILRTPTGKRAGLDSVCASPAACAGRGGDTRGPPPPVENPADWVS